MIRLECATNVSAHARTFAHRSYEQMHSIRAIITFRTAGNLRGTHARRNNFAARYDDIQAEYNTENRAGLEGQASWEFSLSGRKALGAMSLNRE